MERQPDPAMHDAIAEDIEAFEAELGRRVADSNPTINPALGIVEDASNPPTHPLRRGGWLRPTTDPSLRGAEEGAMATGREEILNQPE